MRTSRRILLVVLVLVLALAVPLGATAGTKPKPIKPAEYVYVTMGLLEDADGLATTCTGSDYPGYLDDDGAIKMQRAPMGWRYTASEGYGEWPILQVEAAVPWVREYPQPAHEEDRVGGDSLSGCHGVYFVGGSVPYTPLLQIDTDSSGTPVSLVWHFDRYAEKVGKKTVLREGFDLISGDDFSCVGGNSSYSCGGTFSLESFVTGAGGERVVHGEAVFSFTITFSSP
jgi:hypothetical protein